MKTTTAPVRSRPQQPIAPIGHFRLGGLPFGGHYGERFADSAAEVVSEAVSAGVRMFDTSPLFGRGSAETLLSQTLGSGIRNVEIGSKVALTEGLSPTATYGISRDALLPCLEGSLSRLRRDYLDLYYYDASAASGELGNIIQALSEIREAGLVRGIGLVTTRTDVLRHAAHYARIDAVLVPYNIFNRPSDTEFLTFCRESGVNVHACEPLCRGLLAGNLHRNSVFPEGDLRIMDPRFRGNRYRENIGMVAKLRHFAASEGLSLLELALGWVLQHPSVTDVVCGAKTPGQLHQLIEATKTRLKLEQILEIDLIVGDLKHQSALR